ncbi:MAG: hypothetical protein UX04_C0002G0118 [Microgenomates group bacterium GW2011_GWF2_45_18]|nr:MAG: hypothetical protein UW18_C0005G0055 [Microgenomates group bacterium GW2011_GWF1_44_10]KKU01975.1 MAG: hypothetical protein UX04_C0002G0118 [Microgenomates group bacterium GW2011_GWF2_45_18]OGJ41011.1 MAG: hypothetical protein A2378_03860 [Candidatus Pacebacteria bacterium RIFOXYB1_FULL_44_10]HAU99040.1 hypothetical protein [Candidatus Paceibacterota bacterium]HAX01245.1 hypothetical protein [Candidatus Paceibacterota bacterium]
MAKKQTTEVTIEKTFQEQLLELEKDFVMKKMEMIAGKLKDVRSLSKIRDQIARVKTKMRAQELENV